MKTSYKKGPSKLDSLTKEEIATLKTLIPLAKQNEEEAKFSAARRLVLNRYKSGVIWLAAFLGSLILLRERGAKI